MNNIQFLDLLKQHKNVIDFHVFNMRRKFVKEAEADIRQMINIAAWKAGELAQQHPEYKFSTYLARTVTQNFHLWHNEVYLNPTLKDYPDEEDTTVIENNFEDVEDIQYALAKISKESKDLLNDIFYKDQDIVNWARTHNISYQQALKQKNTALSEIKPYVTKP